MSQPEDKVSVIGGEKFNQLRACLRSFESSIPEEEKEKHGMLFLHYDGELVSWSTEGLTREQIVYVCTRMINMVMGNIV